MFPYFLLLRSSSKFVVVDAAVIFSSSLIFISVRGVGVGFPLFGFSIKIHDFFSLQSRSFSFSCCWFRLVVLLDELSFDPRCSYGTYDEERKNGGRKEETILVPLE